MVRVALLIMSLLGVFLLNACGGRNNSNIDARDAALLQKGRIESHAKPARYYEYDKKGKPRPVTETKYFNHENTSIDVDWDTKKVRIVTELKEEYKKDKKISGPVILEGEISEEGLAYLRPANDAAKALNAQAGFHCEDNTCKTLIADVGGDIKDKNENKYVEDQMYFSNPNPAPVAPEIDEKSGNEEVEPISSGAKNPGEVKGPEAAKSKPTDTNKVTKKAIDPKKEEDESEPEDGETENQIVEELLEPGVPSRAPSILKPEMRNQKGPIKSGDYFGTKVFPIPLGDQYPGVAQKWVNKGKLLKGTDVNSNLESMPVLGFLSVYRDKKRHYASGLTVKMVEEAGKLYAKEDPTGKIQVNYLSKKEGGRMSGHGSHQNGLDIDVHLPLNGKRVDYPRAWNILKSFVQLGFVDLVFLNSSKIKGMCRYLKGEGKITPQNSAIFNKLYAWKGHNDHFHIRVKCTPHNVGCKSRDYKKSKFAICK